jgi:hypothetical protein
MQLRNPLRIVIAAGAVAAAGCGRPSLQGGTGGRAPADGGGLVGGGGTPATGGAGGPGGGSGLGGAGGSTGNAGGSGSGGAIAPDGGGPADGGAADGAVGACPSPVAPPSPLRRLTRFEYNNTVRDLFANTGRPADSLPADGFTNLAVESPAGLELVDGYHKLAHDFAVAATRDAAAVAAVAGCDPAAGKAACEQTFIRDFVARVFRRAAAPDDAAEFGEVFATGRRLGGDFAGGVRAVVEVALQSPEFLYRVERGEPVGPAQPGLARPTPHEMAARLSYLLWGSTPDSTLLLSASQGRLRTKAEIEAQARRLLADDRAHDVVRYFTFQLMRLHDADYLPNLGVNAGFTQQIADLMLEETRLYIDEVTWRGPGNFQALLTSPISFLNGPLAAFYGVPGVTGDGFTKVSLDPARHGGLLTQASILARTSNASSSSPSNRGLLVLQQILCGQIASPPLNETPPALSTTLTTRERYQQATGSAACAACHVHIDPVGFAFEHYDAVGRWRDSENGRPVDARGEIVQTDARGSFDGAVELAQRLAASQDARACYVGKWMGFAYGRAETADDACSRRLLMDAFAASNGNIPELLVALTQTDAFVFRTPSQP